MSQPLELPRWIDLGVLPLLNISLALVVSSLIVTWAGQDPGEVVRVLLRGAFGSRSGWSYTLYYTTTFIFTGLAVAVAFHGGLFNIGGEGQAIMGGVGTALAALAFADHLSAYLMLPLMVLAALGMGLLWAAVPAALQAWRGSHVVITTIMFNFIASVVLVYLLVDVLKEPGNMSPESRVFAPSAHLPAAHEVLRALGLDWPSTPLNVSLILALVAAALVWVLVWRSRAGYGLRAVGFAPEAARYAGLWPRGYTLAAMGISGALAGMVGINEIAGVHHRLLQDFTAGAGFAGIAVSLIGRNHPVGVILAALLFGALYQGGAELAFEVPGFSRDMVFTLQGLVVLFAGALGHVAAPHLARWHAAWRSRRNAPPAPPASPGAASHG